MGRFVVGAAAFPVAFAAGNCRIICFFPRRSHGLEMPLNANGAEYPHLALLLADSLYAPVESVLRAGH